MADSKAPMEERVGEFCLKKGHTIATAESCTGGLISQRVTAVSGSSRYFLGGVVSYSNDAKTHFLGVPAETLASEGAVSEAVACRMAEGARRGFGSDFAVSVTGIAGPTGGTPEKPVGLVHFAVATPSGTHAQHSSFSGSRESVRDQAADRALELLLESMT